MILVLFGVSGCQPEQSSSPGCLLAGLRTPQELKGNLELQNGGLRAPGETWRGCFFTSASVNDKLAALLLLREAYEQEHAEQEQPEKEKPEQEQEQPGLEKLSRSSLASQSLSRGSLSRSSLGRSSLSRRSLSRSSLSWSSPGAA